MAAAGEKTKSKATAKRKRVVLSINDKLEVLCLLDKSVSRSVICEKFGIGKSTVVTFGFCAVVVELGGLATSVCWMVQQCCHPSQ